MGAYHSFRGPDGEMRLGQYMAMLAYVYLTIQVMQKWRNSYNMLTLSRNDVLLLGLWFM